MPPAGCKEVQLSEVSGIVLSVPATTAVTLVHPLDNASRASYLAVGQGVILICLTALHVEINGSAPL